MTVKELIEHLKQFHKPDDVIVAHIWCVEDVTLRAEERDLVVSKEAAENILGIIQHGIDCELGVTWTTIDVYTDDYLEENK